MKRSPSSKRAAFIGRSPGQVLRERRGSCHRSLRGSTKGAVSGHVTRDPADRESLHWLPDLATYRSASLLHGSATICAGLISWPARASGTAGTLSPPRPRRHHDGDRPVQSLRSTVREEETLTMEFLVTMTTHVPDGTSEEEIDEVRTREAKRSHELAADGHLLRLWRPPLQPGEWRTLGLFAADDDVQLEKVLRSMPLHVWRTDEVTPLS